MRPNLLDPLDRLRELAPPQAAAAVRRVLSRPRRVRPFAVSGRLPWHEPGFGGRVLQVHLDQRTDRATRRDERVLAEAGWIAGIAGIKPGTYVLDLSCGPALYLREWAQRGALCLGLDINAVALGYGRGVCAPLAARPGLARADLRRPPCGPNRFDCICNIYGEPSSWPAAELERQLRSLSSLLAPGGTLVLEACSCAGLQASTGALCEVRRSSPFSDKLHIYCEELLWHAATRSRLDRYWIIDAASGALSEYSAAHQGYRPQEMERMIASCGLSLSGIYGDLLGERWSDASEWVVVVAVRP